MTDLTLRDLGRAAGYPDPDPARCPECGLKEAEVRQKGAVKALREAAAWMQNGTGEPYDPSQTDYEQQRREAKARRRWLRDRADAIERGEDQ